MISGIKNGFFIYLHSKINTAKQNIYEKYVFWHIYNLSIHRRYIFDSSLDLNELLNERLVIIRNPVSLFIFSTLAITIKGYEFYSSYKMPSDDDSSSNSLPSSSNPLARQRKLYFLNQELQIMARELPLKYQQRIPNELLCALAESLLDNTVFSIVNTLMDIQHVTEKHLFHERLQLIYNQSLEIQEMMITHHDEAVRFANTNTLQLKHKRALKEFDKNIIKQLDEKVHDQQKFLEKAGVPGFEITDNPSKIQVQIRLLDFILRLSRMKMPE